MQKIETQNSTEQQPIKHKHPNQKRKKPRTLTQKTLTDQPIKHIKRIKRQTKPENEPLVPRSTNPSRSGAEIVKPMALWCQDHDFWVWVFALISRLWFLGLGFWEMGLYVWWRRRRRKNCLEKKNYLGMADGKKKERRKKMVYRNLSLRDSSSTWIYNLLQLWQHTKIESLRLKLLQELKSNKLEMLIF